MSKKTNFFDNLIQLCDYKGIKNMGELSKLLGYKSAEKLYRLERDKNNSPSYQIILDLSNLFEEVDLNWLLTGKGSMIKNADISEKYMSEPVSVYSLKTDNMQQHQSIPLYNLEATAGVVTLFRDSKETKPIDHIQIPNLPKCDGAVYVTGDSMYPLLKSGDIVMYKQMHDIKNGLIYGEMYIISIDYDGDEIVSVKWLQKSEKGDDWIKLVSENQHHPDRDIELSRVRALALVKASIRVNSMS
ncbi:transcriptional regulator [Flavobacterium suaedae]|uniref:Transcriptional regulator n=1 Tax=Flavobacterium suaedae TaxID=1767027 RepID=A0ABQ1K325_9FLAO|nr:S24 family peptidase [Flavobacterium suaedae]GGB82649.1 transcriptional regulator [Flavobacterium suaedae]